MQTTAPTVPQVAVLIGRGRRLGPVLRGGMITQAKVQDILTIAGQDCECGLDRSWMQGPIIPASWDLDVQQRAFKDLGFDAENPLVKNEVSRILARGPAQARTPMDLSGAFPDDVFLGYSEQVIEAEAGDTVPAFPASTPASASVTRDGTSRREPPPLTSSSILQPRDERKDAGKAGGSATPGEATSLPLGKALAVLAGLTLVAMAGGGWVILRTHKKR